MDENDILLVKRLKNREEKAYVFLFEQYYNRLYGQYKAERPAIGVPLKDRLNQLK